VGRVTRITSRSNPLLARLRKLAGDGAASRRSGTVLLEGEHLCEAWCARGGARVLHAIVTDDAWLEPRLRRLAEAADETAIVSASTLASVATLESPPPIAFLVPLPVAVDVDPHAATVVLDRVQDPGNVGSILRSAASFGFTQAIALTGTAALWSPKVVRAGMGAHFALRLVDAVAATSLGALSVPLFGTSSHASVALVDATLPWPCAWAFGHEGQGLTDDVAARCRAVVAVPQPGGGESLNVAAAAAVCMYDTVRRRAA
jgi:TrmH family RNA methyltransferase